jgi:hypothetical protein
MYALVKSEFLRHSDDEIKLMVTSCLSEIMRISAPKTPYNDNMMKEIFQLIEESFHRLDDTRQPSFDRRVRILETVANVRSYVVMIDLKCDDLILRMFQCFFAKIRKYHAGNVITAMQIILSLILDEEDDISKQLISNLLAIWRKEQVVSPIAHELSKGLVEQKIEKIKYQLTEEELISLGLHVTGPPKMSKNQIRREKHCFTCQGAWTSSHICGHNKEGELMTPTTCSSQPSDDVNKEEIETIEFEENALSICMTKLQD